MRERLRQRPALQGRRLIERAGLLFEQRQIMTRLKNKIVAGVAARMTGDQGAVAENGDLLAEAFRQHVAKAILCGNRIIVRAIADDRWGRDLCRDLVASLERRGGKFSKG